MSVKKKFVFIATCICLCVACSGLNYYYRFLPLQQQQTNNTIQKLHTAYRVIIDEYQHSTRLIYSHIITAQGFIPLYKKANSPNKETRDQARRELFTMFDQFYKSLQEINIRQLHFHLPNCDSFLRFHKPEKYGDNLKSVRYSVAKVNSELIEVNGFEEGRIKNGFRYVFPILDNGVHLGSVEVSLNFVAIKNELQELYGNDYSFILKKEVINNKLFPSEYSFYQDSHISPDFMTEQNIKVSPLVSGINALLLKKNIQSRLLTGQSFVVNIMYESEKYLVTFLPISNVMGKQVAYVISYAKNRRFINITKRFIVTTLLFSALIVLAFISFYSITSKNKKLAAVMLQQQESMIYLQETEKNFKRIFHNSQNAVLLIDGNTFVDCNEAVVKMLGATDKEQVIQAHPADLSPPQQPDERGSKEKAEAMIQLARETGFHRFEWEHKRMSGESFPVMVSLTIMTVQNREQLHVLWQDITGQKQHEQNLHEIAEQAKAASHAKDIFLANMSHEIRTPMNGVLGMARLLQEVKLGKQAEDLLAKLIYSAESLLGLLNDILDFSKIEAGQLSLEKQDFSLETMINHLLSSLGFLAAEKGLSFKDNSDYKNLPTWVRGDTMRIKQVLTNLIGNSIKFTERGGITITVRENQSSDTSIILHFTVADTGIGIAKSKQQDLFFSFTQAESSISRKFGGTGLGLAISKQLVDMMGGEIEYTSVLGEGTIFSFTVAVEPGVDNRGTFQVKSASHYKNLNILLAEDNLINQQIAVAVLEQDNHQVRVAKNGLEALHLLAKYDFDLVIMDVQMPIMDGLLATAIIRKCENMQIDANETENSLEKELVNHLSGQHTQILAMTANAMSGDREKCLDAGMDHYLTKPFMPEDLHAALNKLNLPGEHTYKDGNLRKQAALYLIQRYGLDNATTEKLIINACNHIALLQQELIAILPAGGKDLLHETTHSLKISFLNIGLDELADKAIEIERSAKEGVQIDQSRMNDFLQKIELLLG